MKNCYKKQTKISRNSFFDISSFIRISSFVLIFFSFFTAFSFACDLEGHFDFTVRNNEGEILYSGCYDAVNLGPHIIEYNLTRKRAMASGVKRPSVTFTQDRDNGVLKQKLAERGYSLPNHRDYSNSGYDRGTWLLTRILTTPTKTR